MDEMEEKLGSILSNPQMMQQIMAMAQSLGGASEAPPQKELPKPQESPLQTLPNIDIGMLQKLSGLAGQGGIDREQQALLKALGPYISRDRVSKLEKAMRAAKMARLASAFLSQGGLSILSGR